MARSITGRRTPPRFTTGPATRHALAAAGALGATTGSVVHLAAPPTGNRASSSVLAHELAHTRRQVSRPRFLLAAGVGPADEDERAALAVGHGPLGHGPLGHGPLGHGPLGHGALGTTAGPEGSVGAGLVGQLPVGGGVGALGGIAANAARAAVLEATSSPGAAPRRGAIDATSADAPDSGGAAGGSGFANVGFASTGGFGNTGGDAGDTAGSGSGAGGSAGTTSGSGPGGSQAPPAAGAGAPLDQDRVVELVEERLLREIERRGGRWAGVF